MIDLDELIAEARGAFRATNASASLIARLADALESATRVPVQGEPQPQPCSTCGTKYTACTNGIFRPNGKACCSRCAYTDTHQVPIGYEEKQVTQEKPNGDRCLGCGSAEEDGHDDCTVTVRTIRATVPDAATELRAERDAALARIAEAAKLHRPILASWMKGKRCDVCLNDEGWNETWPCPTAVALGLNEGENEK